MKYLLLLVLLLGCKEQGPDEFVGIPDKVQVDCDKAQGVTTCVGGSQVFTCVVKRIQDPNQGNTEHWHNKYTCAPVTPVPPTERP